jgi:hypothetical protein
MSQHRGGVAESWADDNDDSKPGVMITIIDYYLCCYCHIVGGDAA